MSHSRGVRHAAPAMLYLLTLGLSLALLSACSSSEPPATPTRQAGAPSITPAPATPTPSLSPAPTGAPTATPAPRRPEASPFPAGLRQTAEELLVQVLADRGVGAAVQIDMFLLTREQARAFYSGDTGNEDGQTDVPIDAKKEVYQLLGLIPEEDELRPTEVDNLISLITGFYSPPLRALYLLDGINGGVDGPLARSTMVHELTHAVQYQTHDILQEVAQRSNSWDATTALLDVLEGDAVATEIRVLGYSTRSTYRQPVCFSIPLPQRFGTPFIVERELDTWYEDGLCFVQNLQQVAGLTIADIFANLPDTTEQILHPEKYLAGEGATPVFLARLEPLLPNGWHLEATNSFGEFTLQNLLQPGLAGDLDRIQAAAAGWGGDGLDLYTNGEAFLLNSLTVWDSAADAFEFWRALRDSLANRSDVRLGFEDVDCLQAQALNGVVWQAQIKSDSVRLIVTDDRTALTAVASNQPECPTP